MKVPFSKKVILGALHHFFELDFSDFSQEKEIFSARISAKNLNKRTLSSVLRFLAPFMEFITRSQQD